MLSYLLRRLLYAVPILIGVSILTFGMFYMVKSPRQLAKQNLGKNPTDEQVQVWLQEHGYDKPLGEQARKHIGELLMLKFGKSDTSDERVWDKIGNGAGPSLALAVPMFFASALAAVSLALFAAYFRGTYLDYWGVFFCVLLMSINYVLYFVAGQYIFARLLRIYPLAGYAQGWDALRFVALPGLVGVVAGLGGAIRYNRAAFLEEMHQDYVRTARSKGVAEAKILFTHVLKNAATPILTSLVLSIPFLFMGNLLLESFFGIPGLGSMTVDAINSGDFAVVRAMVFLGTLAYIAGNILTDVSYALVNPRVRLE
ncbi:MAG: ABC transporter permease [Armatimonadota bacterium]